MYRPGFLIASLPSVVQVLIRTPDRYRYGLKMSRPTCLGARDHMVFDLCISISATCQEAWRILRERFKALLKAHPYLLIRSFFDMHHHGKPKILRNKEWYKRLTRPWSWISWSIDSWVPRELLTRVPFCKHAKHLTWQYERKSNRRWWPYLTLRHSKKYIEQWGSKWRVSN